MNYHMITLKILYELGAHKLYKGNEYISSCIDYIAQHETTFIPITKVLYVDIAKSHHTSRYNIESGIRSIIELIWEQHENKDLITKIFGRNAVDHKPANLEFLITLYNYIKLHYGSTELWASRDLFICPASNDPCPFYRDIVITVIEKI